MQPGPLETTYRALAEELSTGALTCTTCGEPTIRVGTDVQEIAAVAAALDRHGERYLSRLFTAAEVENSRGASFAWTRSGTASLAARYAVKEAVIKVLRPASGLRWPSVEVVRQPGGWSSLALHADALALATDSGLSSWTLSFAHDGGLAVATVLARHGCTDAQPGSG